LEHPEFPEVLLHLGLLGHLEHLLLQWILLIQLILLHLELLGDLEHPELLEHLGDLGILEVLQ
jgi:hypothetical protein